METWRRTHESIGCSIYDSDSGLPRGSNHENHCFYTTWLLAVQKKQIRFARDCRGRYLDHRTLHDAGTLSSRILYTSYTFPSSTSRSLPRSCFIILLSERFVLRDWIYGRDPEILHHHRQTHHSQDADVDGRCVCLQELLHHIRHVSPCLLLRVSRHHNLRHGEIRRRHRKVRKVQHLCEILRCTNI